MPVYLLGDDVVFPPVDHAEEGLLAVGGDLSPERLLAAYSLGIFPWYSEGGPILWHSPDPRFVVTQSTFRLPRSLQRTLRSGRYRFTLDTRFRDVLEGCATAPRPGQDGTWITAEMKYAYLELHHLGFAHSVEAWSGDELVGGLYGVSLGAAFFGESMFARQSDASKAAFATLVPQLGRWGIGLVDCQVETEHLARFGGESWPRERYLKALRRALRTPTVRGRWSLDA